MSAQAEKVLRRDLRRAVGAEAIGVIDHNAQVIASLQQRVQQQYLDTISGFKEHDRRLQKHRAMLDAHTGILLRPTFWQRLRWLVRGV